MTLPSIYGMVRERLGKGPDFYVFICPFSQGGLVASTDQGVATIDAEHAIGATKAELADEIVRQLKEGT